MSEATVKLKELHSAQQQILDEAKRFNVLKCGRRFGKTTLSQELSIQPMIDGFPVGLWFPTYKDLDDVWNELNDTLYRIISKSNLQLKQIKLITGGKIDMWSLDDPDSGRGRKYKRAIIDEAEKSKHLEQAWKGTIRPTLTDYQGDAWFLSTPRFGDTYFKSLSNLKYDKNFSHEWMSWRFTTYDNPFMNPDEINAAKATLDPFYFNCEYLAEDVDLAALRWAFAYDRQKHVGKCSINFEYPVYLSFDFNRNPICCSIIQHYDSTIFIPYCIKLANSNIYSLCDYILSGIPGMHIALFIITGDATGRASNAMVKDQLNYYIIIKQKLNLSDGQLKVPTINPRLEDNQVLVNSLLSNYNWVIDEDNAKGVIYDMENCRVLPDGGIDKSDRKDPTKQNDAIDTIRYFANSEFSWFLKLN